MTGCMYTRRQMLDRSTHSRQPACGWCLPAERTPALLSGQAGYQGRFDGMFQAAVAGQQNQKAPEHRTDRPAYAHSATATTESSRSADLLLPSASQIDTARAAVQFCPGRSAQDRLI